MVSEKISGRSSGVARGAAVVGHAFWGRPGGGQLVAAAAAKSLADAGYRVVLAAVSRFDPRRYLDWYGIDLRGYPIVSSRFEIRLFGIYQRLLTYRYVEKAVKKYRARLVFIDEVFYKPLARKNRHDLRIIEYVHFPYEAIVYREFREFIKGSEESWRYVEERYGRFPMNIYWRLWLTLVKYFKRDNPFHDADIVLTNSRWTASIIKKVYGEEPVVLNPPLPPQAFPGREVPGFEDRGKTIVMLGRFSEEKRYHWVIENVLPRLLREEPEARLVIIGGSRTRPSRAYIERLIALARRRGISVERGECTRARLCLLENAPRSEINKVMDSSRVFLHATIGEHWGIAVAEAMARGLPVVVHQSGGAWTDLAGEGRYGVGYTTAEEATEAILKLLHDARVWRKYSGKGFLKAKSLSIDKFGEKLVNYIRRV